HQATGEGDQRGEVAVAESVSQLTVDAGLEGDQGATEHRDDGAGDAMPRVVHRWRSIAGVFAAVVARSTAPLTAFTDASVDALVREAEKSALPTETLPMTPRIAATTSRPPAMIRKPSHTWPSASPISTDSPMKTRPRAYSASTPAPPQSPAPVPAALAEGISSLLATSISCFTRSCTSLVMAFTTSPTPRSVGVGVVLITLLGPVTCSVHPAR